MSSQPSPRPVNPDFTASPRTPSVRVRRLRWLAFWAGVLGLLHGTAVAAGMAAVSGGILKVLPHLLDTEGRAAVAPSLFQRDAYQAYLRQHPEKVSTLRYDVHCRVAGRSAEAVTLRLSLRTAQRGEGAPLVLEIPVKRGWFGRTWQSVTVDPAAYRAAGDVLAWRAELLAGSTVIASQNSFLW